MYQERPSRLAGAVAWSHAEMPDGNARVLPDGCMDLLLWNEELVIAGPDTRAYLVTDTPEITRGAITGLRFSPGLGPVVFGVSASELRDQRVPLNAVWPQRRVRELAERAAAATEPARALEDIAAVPLGSQSGHDSATSAVVSAVPGMARRGQDMQGMARAVGLSERQLHRRSLDAFGYGPKMLGRVLRMQRALQLVSVQAPLADVAIIAGYADQAHLAREVHALAGVPVTWLSLSDRATRHQ